MTGGSGANTYVFAAGDSILSVGGHGTSGTISGYDVITNFTPGQTAQASEKIDFSNVSVATTTSTNNSGLDLHTGFTVTSDNISNGIVTFNDTHGNNSVSLTSLSDVAAAVDFLQNNDIGTTGSTVAFTATIGAVAHTFVFIQGSSDGSSDNSDVLIDVDNVTATALSASGDQLSVVDGVAPAAPTITGFTTDSGTVGDHITNDTSLTINGTAEANSTVTVYENGVSFGTTTANGSGNWSLADSNTLSNGSIYQFTATATDLAGNTSSPSANYAATIDATAPAVAKTGYNNTTHTLSGTYADVGGSGVTTVHISDTTHTNSGNATLSGGNWTYTNSSLRTNDSLTIVATDLAGNQTTITSTAPAGVAGAPINLGLTDSSGVGALTTVTIGGMPAGWRLNEGTNLGNGAWTVETDDLSALTVLTAAAYAGAAVLNVTETWANADGSTGTAFVSDNVEAYAPGSPIFALSGDDNLTGAGANDLFVFAQPIGNDVVYNFNAASDKIDLMGFTNVAGFSDLHIADNANGDAVVTVGSGETITLHGVHAAALTADDFVFDQAPVVENAGTMVISDGAVLPLGGTIDNTGSIALDSSGQSTELQLVGDGITLHGGGHVTMSGEAVIAGTTSASTLTNVDNIISGAGQIGSGDGNLTLVNGAHGTIDANVAGATLTLDTGHAIANAGVLEASNGGALLIADAVSGGSAIVAGGTMTFDAQSNVNVTFDNGAGTAYGELVLGRAADFSGGISGFTGTAPDAAHSDAIDLKDISFGPNTTFAYDDNAGTDSGGTLAIFESGNKVDAVVFTNGDYNTANFTLSSDGSGGTLITDPPTSSGTTIAPPASVDTLSGTDGHDSFAFDAIANTHAGAGHLDTIADFAPSHDEIDFSAITGITGIQGLIADGAQLAPHSVAWVQSGATTIVYANATASAEVHASADMEVHLASVTAAQLASANFILHH